MFIMYNEHPFTNECDSLPVRSVKLKLVTYYNGNDNCNNNYNENDIFS